MGDISTMIGAGIVAIILIYLFAKLGKDSENRSGDDGEKYTSFDPERILKIVIIVLVAGLLLVIGKAAIDDKDFCAWNPVNSTVVNTTTTYDFVYQCEANDDSGSETLYQITLWFMYLISGFIVFILLWVLVWIIRKLFDKRTRK